MGTQSRSTGGCEAWNQSEEGPNDSLLEGGCDTHHHIFQPKDFSYSINRHLTPPTASVDAYKDFKKSLGITASVLVHGLSYGDDCMSLKAFMSALDPRVTRGVAVINEETDDAEIDDLHAAGVRGIRLDLYKYKAMEDLALQVKVLSKYASRVKRKKWSLDFLQLKAENWKGLAQVIPTLGVQVVTEHHALLKAKSMLPAHVDVLTQPGLHDIVALLKTGRFWIKLSAPYRSSNDAPLYNDMKELVMMLVETNPRRVLWGSDWPHTPRMKVRTREEALKEVPFLSVDDKAWLTSLKMWLSSEQWSYLMIQNPKELYDLHISEL